MLQGSDDGFEPGSPDFRQFRRRQVHLLVGATSLARRATCLLRARDVGDPKRGDAARIDQLRERRTFGEKLVSSPSRISRLRTTARPRLDLPPQLADAAHGTRIAAAGMAVSPGPASAAEQLVPAHRHIGEQQHPERSGGDLLRPLHGQAPAGLAQEPQRQGCPAFFAAAGLALATKSTAYLIGLPLGLWFLAANLRAGPHALPMLIACGFLLLPSNLPTYLRNFD
jgi:hypothetical protein